MMMNIEYEINRISSLLRVRSGGGVEKYEYGADGVECDEAGTGTELDCTFLTVTGRGSIIFTVFNGYGGGYEV